MSQPTPEPADETIPAVVDEPESRPWGLPLYAWVLIAVALAIPVGLALGVDASKAESLPPWAVKLLGGLVVVLDLLPDLIIRALGALAAPLVGHFGYGGVFAAFAVLAWACVGLVPRLFRA